jgi:hypothetical protein
VSLMKVSPRVPNMLQTAPDRRLLDGALSTACRGCFDAPCAGAAATRDITDSTPSVSARPLSV